LKIRCGLYVLLERFDLNLLGIMLLWYQCPNLYTQLENILSTKNLKSTPYAKTHTKQLNFMDNLQTVGELAIVHDRKTKTKAKMKDKEIVAMFVGYADNHAGESRLFLNLATKRKFNSCTAIFLQK
jgi:hypothetical protein